MPLAPELDTAGFLTRDPFLWGTAQKVLYDGLETFSSYPKKIYICEFPTNASETDSDGILIDFVNKLAKFLSANVGPINLTSLWTKPANATSSLTDLLNITYPILISQEQTKLVRDPFYTDYCKVHEHQKYLMASRGPVSPSSRKFQIASSPVSLCHLQCHFWALC
jgi:hypothetical protein